MMISLRNALVGNKRLPYDAEVEYLESTGTQWIDTDETFRKNIILQFPLMYKNLTYYGWGLNANNYEVLWINNGNLYFGNGYGNIGYSPEANIKYDFSFDFSAGNMVAKIDNNIVRQTSGTQPTYGKICLFALNNKGTITPISVRHYGFSIYENDVLIRDFIPVRVGGVGYMYDKVSKKLFGNQGTGNFVVGRDINPISARSYINDGLVAMWDGIEVAGWGIHDGATTWKNLVGNGELVFSNGITINDDSVGFALGASAYSNNNMGLTTSNVSHGELCIEMASPPLNEQYAQFASSTSRIFANAYSARGDISLVSGQLGHGNWPTGKHTMSVNWPSNELHIDSVLRDTVTTKDSWSLRTKSTVIGNVLADSSNNRGFNGKVYCIRLYSRALTADEIAANYAIDKQRFNLP